MALPGWVHYRGQTMRRRLSSGYRVTALQMLAALLLLSAGPAWAKKPNTPREPVADPYEVLDQMGEALQLIEEQYYEPADQAELLRGALRGMVGELDPHTSYFTPKERAIFEGSTSGKFGGIGVEVEFEDGEIIVIAPVEGSPAARAGIQPDDRIVALDGIPLSDIKPHEVVGMMRGRIGTKLTLTVKSKGKFRKLSITREQISVSSVRGELLESDIAYFRIKAFQRNTHSEFLSALGDLREESPSLSGVILDLRNNPGGLVREATALADEFLSGGTIYTTRHRKKVLRRAEASSSGALTKGPIVVLINEYSASAAELVAGALKDRGRARVLGARSFGKGSVQTVLHLGHGGALKLTTALYYTPSGQTTQARGVTPHTFVDPGYDQGSQMRVLKESDLPGHLKDEEKKHSSIDAGRGEGRGAPPTNQELHLGVARRIEKDPSQSPDKALRAAYRLLRDGKVMKGTKKRTKHGKRPR